MWSFFKLKKFDIVGPDTKIYRKPEIQSAYDKYREEHPYMASIVVRQILSDKNDINTKVLIEPNKFPYDIDNTVTQYVIWVNPMYDITENDVRIIITKYISPANFSLFRQNPKYGSIPALMHFHLFVKKGTDIGDLLGKH